MSRATRDRDTRRWLRRAFAAALGLTTLIGVVFGCAYLLRNQSGVARAIIWMEADTDDYERFPSRSIESGEPDRFRSAPLPLDRLPVAGQGLAELLSASETTAFVVIADEAVVYERYPNGSSRDSIQTSFSVAKSFASALVGIAIEAGAIGSVDDPITGYLPELAERDPRFSEITIEHLLTMASGLRYEESGLPWGDDAETYYATDLRDLALTDTEVVEAPGTSWHYNNYNPLLLGLILERATGLSVSEYLERELWRPLGAEFDASWSLDSEGSGFEKMESGINACAIDFARLGVLFLDRGRWQGRSIVPSSWVASSTAPSQTASHYGYWWWLERGGAYLARGNLGQFLYVNPRKDVVIARFGDDDGDVDWPALFSELALAVKTREGS